MDIHREEVMRVSGLAALLLCTCALCAGRMSAAKSVHRGIYLGNETAAVGRIRIECSNFTVELTNGTIMPMYKEIASISNGCVTSRFQRVLEECSLMLTSLSGQRVSVPFTYGCMEENKTTVIIVDVKLPVVAVTLLVVLLIGVLMFIFLRKRWKTQETQVQITDPAACSPFIATAETPV